MKPLRLAVDTNVLLDVALEVDDVLDCLDTLDQRLPVIATPHEIVRKFFR